MSTAATPNQRLMESHRAYARAIAAVVLRGLPPHVERAEIEAAAELGLIEAAAAFDGRSGVQFRTFAYRRIRGAIFDAIRKAAWFARSRDRRPASKAGAATAACPGGETASRCMLSLDSGGVEALADAGQSAEEALIEREWSARLHRALPQLAARNRAVLEAYYFRGETLEEIGAAMGLSKSWVCRLHAAGLEMLRRLLLNGPRRPAFALPSR
jgi:RNA polymerase sigma factor for flagellar operon FliA